MYTTFPPTILKGKRNEIEQEIFTRKYIANLHTHPNDPTHSQVVTKVWTGDRNNIDRQVNKHGYTVCVHNMCVRVCICVCVHMTTTTCQQAINHSRVRRRMPST